MPSKYLTLRLKPAKQGIIFSDFSYQHFDPFKWGTCDVIDSCSKTLCGKQLIHSHPYLLSYNLHQYCDLSHVDENLKYKIDQNNRTQIYQICS